MSTDAITKVEQACAELIANQQPITFTQVAARTGLSRTTLYRNPSLRALIQEHRHHAAQAGTLSSLTAEITTLQTIVEAIAGHVRRHEEQLRQIAKQRH